MFPVSVSLSFYPILVWYGAKEMRSEAWYSCPIWVIRLKSARVLFGEGTKIFHGCITPIRSGSRGSCSWILLEIKEIGRG